jgi:hypothetical protein
MSRWDNVRCVRKEVEVVRAGKGELTFEEKQALLRRTRAAYPSAELEVMVLLGANAVAAELARAGR